jgi:hypothetical protein
MLLLCLLRFAGGVVGEAGLFPSEYGKCSCAVALLAMSAMAEMSPTCPMAAATCRSDMELGGAVAEDSDDDDEDDARRAWKGADDVTRGL